MAIEPIKQALIREQLDARGAIEVDRIYNAFEERAGRDEALSRTEKLLERIVREKWPIRRIEKHAKKVAGGGGEHDDAEPTADGAEIAGGAPAPPPDGASAGRPDGGREPEQPASRDAVVTSPTRPHPLFSQEGGRVIIEETDRLNRVVTQFLDYSRPESVEFKAVDMNVLVKKTVELIRPTLRQEILLEFTPAGEQALVSAVSEQIQQVLFNLIQNSAKALASIAERGIQTGIILCGIRHISPESSLVLAQLALDEVGGHRVRPDDAARATRGHGARIRPFLHRRRADDVRAADQGPDHESSGHADQHGLVGHGHARPGPLCVDQLPVDKGIGDKNREKPEIENIAPQGQQTAIHSNVPFGTGETADREVVDLRQNAVALHRQNADRAEMAAHRTFASLSWSRSVSTGKETRS